MRATEKKLLKGKDNFSVRFRAQRAAAGLRFGSHAKSFLSLQPLPLFARALKTERVRFDPLETVEKVFFVSKFQHFERAQKRRRMRPAPERDDEEE